MLSVKYSNLVLIMQLAPFKMTYEKVIIPK